MADFFQLLLQFSFFGSLGLGVLIVVWYLNFWNYSKGLKNIKGPRPIPLIGNAFNLDPSVLFWQLNDWLREYGNTMKGIVGLDFLVSITEPELIEFVCTNTATTTKGQFYRYLHNWLGFGLLTSSGKKWHKRRKLITPTYHFKILEQFVPVFDKNGNILIKKLQEKVGESSFDVQNFISLYTLDVINETAMGISVNAQINSDTEYIRAIKTLTRIVIERCFQLRKHFDLLYFFTKDYKLEKKCLSIIDKYSLDVIESRRQELSKHPEVFDPNYVDEFGRKTRIAFLDLLLQSTDDGVPLSNKDIQEEVDTFMFEGHDTTSSALCFWLHLISKHPDVQEKLMAEQRGVFGDEPFRQVNLGDLQGMSYMEMTIKETLRLYPSVPVMIRENVENLTFRDMTFKKGTQFGIFPFYLHRRSDLYENPDDFIPERFSPENSNKRHPFAYMAFSAGSRNCIGQKFAMLEMKCILSKILRHFEIVRSFPEHEIVIKCDIILSSSNGFNIQLKNRKW